MSKFTDVRDQVVTYAKANPHVVYAVVAFIVGFVVGKVF